MFNGCGQKKGIKMRIGISKYKILEKRKKNES